MKLKIDEQADALYLRLNDTAIVESEEVQAGVILDFDADGRVVGVELLGIKDRVLGEALRSVTVELA